MINQYLSQWGTKDMWYIIVSLVFDSDFTEVYSEGHPWEVTIVEKPLSGWSNVDPALGHICEMIPSLQNKIWNLPDRSTILRKFIYDKEGKLAKSCRTDPNFAGQCPRSGTYFEDWIPRPQLVKCHYLCKYTCIFGSWCCCILICFMSNKLI